MTKMCVNCGERLPEIKNCASCGAVMQAAWKACGDCGARVDGARSGASININDSVVGTINQNQTDRSINVGGDVSGTVIGGETVNIESINVQTISPEEWRENQKKMDLILEKMGIRATSRGSKSEPLSTEQTAVASAVRSKVEEGERRFGLESGDPNLYVRVGWAAFMAGDIADATRNFELAKKISDSHDDIGKSASASAQLGLGLVAHLRDEYDQALRLSEGALKVFQELGDRSGIANSLNNIGEIHYDLGDLDLALEKYKASFAIVEELGDRSGIANSLNNIGLIHYDLGDLGLALEKHERSLAIVEELGDRSGTARSLNNIGLIHYDLGDLDLALEKHERSLAIAEELGHSYAIAACLGQVALIHDFHGNLDLALEKHERSLAILE
jgi:tetratricopeptide (TPR) repeat protein